MRSQQSAGQHQRGDRGVGESRTQHQRGQRVQPASRISPALGVLQSAARHFPESAAAAAATRAPGATAWKVLCRRDSCFLSSVNGRRRFSSAARNLPFLFTPGQPGRMTVAHYFAGATATVLQPGMVACSNARLDGLRACRSCFWRRPGRDYVPFDGRPWWQSDCPRRAAKRLGLVHRHEIRVIRRAGNGLIWLPAARGESNASLAVALKVIAVRAAAPMVMRRIRVFIFIFLSFGRRFIASAEYVVFVIHRSRRKSRNIFCAAISRSAIKNFE